MQKSIAITILKTKQIIYFKMNFFKKNKITNNYL